MNVAKKKSNFEEFVHTLHLQIVLPFQPPIWKKPRLLGPFATYAQPSWIFGNNCSLYLIHELLWGAGVTFIISPKDCTTIFLFLFAALLNSPPKENAKICLLLMQQKEWTHTLCSQIANWFLFCTSRNANRYHSRRKNSSFLCVNWNQSVEWPCHHSHFLLPS